MLIILIFCFKFYFTLIRTSPYHHTTRPICIVKKVAHACSLLCAQTATETAPNITRLWNVCLCGAPYFTNRTQNFRALLEECIFMDRIEPLRCICVVAHAAAASGVCSPSYTVLCNVCIRIVRNLFWCDELNTTHVKAKNPASNRGSEFTIVTTSSVDPDSEHLCRTTRLNPWSGSTLCVSHHGRGASLLRTLSASTGIYAMFANPSTFINKG